MPLNITEFKGALTGDGARPNLFQVTINNPVSSIANYQNTFHGKRPEIPAATLGEIQQFYQGRAVKYAGDRTYADWTVTIINDEDFLSVMQWKDGTTQSMGIDQMPETLHSLLLQYKTSATVTQLSKTGLPLRTYAFEGIYPKEISNITLDWGGNDSIEDVYSYFLI
jgi:hypothetical protein